MSMKNNTVNLEKKQYHHLTYDERVKIEFMLNEKDENGKRLYSNTDIANKLGVHKSTISRELKRIKSKINVVTDKIRNLPYSAFSAKKWIVNIFLDNFYKDNCKRYCTGV